jgi:8-oxo-dGTP pyrophosphatase MutT (NUDIX family)
MSHTGSAHGKHEKNGKPRVEYSAGGVVFRRTAKGILVGLIKDSYGKWAFAKGRIEKKETPSTAAVREACEEMGIAKLRLISFLGQNSIWFKDRYEHVGQTVHKYIAYFLMEAAPDEHGRPEGRDRVQAIKWIPYRDLPRHISYKNSLPIAKKAVSTIEVFCRKY